MDIIAELQWRGLLADCTDLEAISKRLPPVTDVQANTLEHKVPEGCQDPRWLSIPRNV